MNVVGNSDSTRSSDDTGPAAGILHSNGIDRVIIERESVQPVTAEGSDDSMIFSSSVVSTESLHEFHHLGDLPKSPRSIGSVPATEYDDAERVLAEPDSQYIEIGGVNVHFRVVHNDDGEDDDAKDVPVILLHGFGGGVFSW